MGNVVIAPNIKRTSDRIDPAGNIINAKTKEIIKPIEQEYIPPTPVVEPIVEQVEKPSSKLDEIISRKIEELVAKKVEEILNKL